MSTAPWPSSEIDPSLATDSVGDARPLVLVHLEGDVDLLADELDVRSPLPTSKPATRTGAPVLRPATLSNLVFSL